MIIRRDVTFVRIIRIRMMAVKELYNMESAAIYIEVNVSLLEIRCNGFPYLYFRMHLFHFAPCGISNTLAVNLGRNKQYLKITSVSFDF